MDPTERPQLQAIQDRSAFRAPEAFVPRFVLAMALAPPHHTPTLLRRRDRFTPVAVRLFRGWRP